MDLLDKVRGKYTALTSVTVLMFAPAVFAQSILREHVLVLLTEADVVVLSASFGFEKIQV